jgi:phenylpropionate dioxygenase-like ring-hydroxylating dioxygenase large terminal subunit
MTFVRTEAYRSAWVSRTATGLGALITVFGSVLGEKCDHVPASPDMRIPDRLYLKTYPAFEKYGLIWTRLRGAATDPEKQAIYGIPKMPHWDNPEFQQIVCPTIDIGGFAGRQLEGFLDVAHFGFVRETGQ